MLKSIEPPPLSFSDIRSFHQKLVIFVISGKIDTNFNTQFVFVLTIIGFMKVFLIKVIVILMQSRKNGYRKPP